MEKSNKKQEEKNNYLALIKTCEYLEVWRFVGNETDALDLTGIVESDYKDKGVVVYFLSFLETNPCIRIKVASTLSS